MNVSQRRQHKILTAIGAGALVWIISSLADVVLLPVDRSLLPRQVMANFIGGLIAVVVALVLQLRHEEVHYRVGMERAVIVAELNHHVRNAIFPLRMAVMSLGNAEANKTADEAMERINIALRDATTDALSGKIDYAVAEGASAKP